MRITAIRATPVNIPYRTEAHMSGVTNQHSTRTIIEVETDRDLIGLRDRPAVMRAEFSRGWHR